MGNHTYLYNGLVSLYVWKTFYINLLEYWVIRLMLIKLETYPSSR